MESTSGNHLGNFTLLPAPEGTCPECAVNHPPDQPHNQQSLFYQYHFYNENGRWPTWKDALAHCPDGIKDIWIQALSERGITVE